MKISVKRLLHFHHKTAIRFLNWSQFRHRLLDQSPYFLIWHLSSFEIGKVSNWKALLDKERGNKVVNEDFDELSKDYFQNGIG